MARVNNADGRAVHDKRSILRFVYLGKVFFNGAIRDQFRLGVRGSGVAICGKFKYN